MPKVTVDGSEFGNPLGIKVFALAMIVIGALGILVNLNGYISADPTYPSRFWLAFAGLKGLGFIGGIMLLQMRRMGIWWSLASFVIGVPVALLATDSVPILHWVGAAAVTALILGAGWLAIRNHWHELRPQGPTLGAK